MSELEVRYYTGSVPELRAAGGKRTLVGTAPPWGVLSADLGGWREQFARGAFGDLAGLDVLSTFEHQDALLLGRTPDTLRLVDGEAGLEYQVDLPDATAGRDVAEYVSRGDLRGSSFEFWTDEDSIEEMGGMMIRTVIRARLRQVGPVLKPAYPVGTEVMLRRLVETVRERSRWSEAARRRVLDAAARGIMW